MSEEQNAEAIQDDVAVDVVAAGDGEQNQEQEQEQVQEQEQQTQAIDDLNDPNSDYWKDQAKSQGWSEDFKGDPLTGKFQKTAREFVNDGNFIHQINSVKKGQERMEQEFKRNTETQLAMQKSAHEATVAELSAKRDDAIDEADRDAALGYQGQIDKLNENKPAAQQAPPPYNPGTDPAVRSYEERNAWLNDISDPTAPNYAKAQYADKVFSAALMRGMPSQDALKEMDASVRQAFPANNPNRQRAPNSEGSRRPGNRGSSSLSYEQLSGSEQKQIDMAVSNGMFTKDEAVKKINEFRSEA